MSDIQFDEDQESKRSISVGQKPLFVRLVLATGIVSTDKAAEYILLGIVGLSLVIMTVVISSSGGAPVPSQMEQGRAVDQSQFARFK